MGDGSNFYVSGMSMWNQKFSSSGANGKTLAVKSSTTSIEGISCTDVTIDVVNMTMSIVKNGTEVSFDINEIISLDTQANIMTVHSGDKTLFWIFFVTNADLVSVNTRITNVMNGNADPGC